MAPVEKAKDFKRTLRRLWNYFGRERKLLLCIFVLILISAGIGLSVPYLIGRSIDAMSAEKNIVDFGLLGVIILILLMTYMADSFIQFLQGWLMAGVSQRIVKGLRTSLFDKLQKLPIVYFDTRTHGEIMSRLASDIENVSSTISLSSIQLMSSSITILGSLIMMIRLSPLLTGASLITVPMVFLLARTIAKRTKVLFKEQQATLGRLNGHIEETISGIQVVKAFNHEDKAIDQFDTVNSKLCQVGIKAQVLSGFIMPLMNVINNVGFAVVAGVGGVIAVSLKNINFEALEGSTTALVGPTGAGKTTIVNLLARFYDVSSGRILIEEQT